MAKPKMTYQQSIEILEKIIQEINNGNISIDELHDKVKQARELLIFCQEKLRKTEEDLEQQSL